MDSAVAAPANQAEVQLTGRGIAPGLGMGPARIVGDLLKCTVTPIPIGEDAIPQELERLKQSFDVTLAELESTAQRIEQEFDAALGAVFRAHGMLLRDLYSSGEFERELRSSLFTAETAVRRVFQRWYRKFEALENQILRQRADDVLDLGRNILRRLRGVENDGLEALAEHSVLVFDRLLPSDVVRLPKAKIAAIVVESLGQGSHAALLVREKGIPTITEVPGIAARVVNGTELLVDGYRGSLVIAPSPTTRAEFQKRVEQWQTTLFRCKGACREPARTRDGQLVRVDANIGVQDDVSLALENGADGVGLLRIEQLYFARATPPSEAELYAALKQLVTPLGERPVTIRLLDIGGDKPLPYLRLPPTSNPVLGRRGVRLLLEYPQLTRTQVGAILRLSQEHPVRMLIPMVTLEEDVQRMRETFDGLAQERGIARPPALGAMVETPAAALALPVLEQHVDFFCVGTNDLAQYTLAAARDDADVNLYYQDSHEAIWRMLSIILADARDRPVTLCGELAGRDSWVPRMLRMGFRDLSVAPTVIPTTKAAVRGVDLGEHGTAARDDK
jgi:phosphoenolpyruvate-protein phosphotransferase